MSLVVLRSWSDGPPKVRGIAPSDNAENNVEYVPDHKGQFDLTQKKHNQHRPRNLSLSHHHRFSLAPTSEMVPKIDSSEQEPQQDSSLSKMSSESFRNRSRSHNSLMSFGLSAWEPGRKRIYRTSTSDRSDSERSETPTDGLVREITPEATTTPASRFDSAKSASILTNSPASLTLVSAPLVKAVPASNMYRRHREQRNSPEKLVSPESPTAPHHHLRSISASPDQGAPNSGDADAADNASTPPSSPILSGRYRNLGPELAACIPRRQLKNHFNWMRDDPNNIGIKWMSERRSLSLSTPSLSQDFYSSEEEKMPSFSSSQSSSATPSPQPQNLPSLQEPPKTPTALQQPDFELAAKNSPLTLDPPQDQYPHPSLSPDSGCDYSPRPRRPRQRQPDDLSFGTSSPPPPPPSLPSVHVTEAPPPPQPQETLSTSAIHRSSSGSSISSNETDTTAVADSDVLSSKRGFSTTATIISTSSSSSSDDEEPRRARSLRPNSEVILVEVIRKKSTASSIASSSRESLSSPALSASLPEDSDTETVSPGSQQRSKNKKKSSGFKQSALVDSSSSQSSDDADELQKRQGSSGSLTQAPSKVKLCKPVVAKRTSSLKSTERSAEQGEGELLENLLEKNASSSTPESDTSSETPVVSTAAPETGAERHQGLDERQLNTDPLRQLEASPCSENIESHLEPTRACGSEFKSVVQNEVKFIEQEEEPRAIAESVVSEVIAEVERRLSADPVREEAKAQLEQEEEDNNNMERRGKFYYEGASPIASLRIPVEAINKHVVTSRTSGVPPTPPDLEDFETMDLLTWQKRSSVRDSFKGFCQDLLDSSSSPTSSTGSNSNEPLVHRPAKSGTQAKEKIVIHVPLSKPPEAVPSNKPHRTSSNAATKSSSKLNNSSLNPDDDAVLDFEDDGSDVYDEDDDGHCSSLSPFSEDLVEPDLSSVVTMPAQECNNSVEYISVLDNVQQMNQYNNNNFKDNKVETAPTSTDAEQSLLFLQPPKPIKWIISLDLGSKTSGFSYWHSGEPNMVHLGSWASEGNACHHKIPSWVLMNLQEEAKDNGSAPIISNVRIGQDALDDYTENRGKQTAFVSQWREFFQLDSEAAKLLTFPYTLESVEDKMDFAMLIKSLVGFFAKAALRQIQARLQTSLENSECIEWVITIPTSWNAESRQYVREAAYKSGVIRPQDGVNLVEDPVAASFFASMCNGYDRFISMDVGGAFVHFAGFEKLHGRYQVAFPSKSISLPSPESTFESRLTQIVGREFMLYYKAKYRPGWIELTKSFDRAKCKFDTSCIASSSAFVFLPSSFVTEFHNYTGLQLPEVIRESTSKMSWNENGALHIPASEMRNILKSSIEFVTAKLELYLAKHPQLKTLILTGGFAKNKFLTDAIKAKFPIVNLVKPKECANAVLQGATLSLMPKLTSKLVIKAPFSIGVGVMTPFDPAVHPEEKKIVKDDKTWCADAWDTLISVGQDMEINTVINKRSYVGAQPGQLSLVLPLFKSAEPNVPQLVTHKSVIKCCELRLDTKETWQEVDLFLICRASELVVMAIDRDSVVHRVVIDFV